MTVPEALRELARPSAAAVGRAIEQATAAAIGAGDAEVAVTVHDTPIGPLGLAGTEPGLLAVSFGDIDAFMASLSELVSPRIVASSAPLESVRTQLDEYFEGSRTAFEVAIDWRLSSGFRLDVLHELARVGYGETVSYQELARRSGRPSAARAVGTAMATNPIPIILPCHRVLRSGGGLGGYAGGLEAKRRLLALEGGQPV